MERLEVISPLGGEVARMQSITARLPTLNGRTVGEIWNGVFKGDQTFPAMRALLKRRFPDLRIIPYTEFPHLHGGDSPGYQKEFARQVAALAKERGCDAVISGNGA